MHVKDIFQNYRKHQLLKHLGIFSLSLVFALSINMLVLDGKTGEYLKANILETDVNHQVDADIQASLIGDKIIFMTNKDMSQVSELSFSVTYNPETGTPDSAISSLLGSQVSEISNQAGITSYLINFSEAQNIRSGTRILELSANKQGEKTGYLNIMNVNFKDASGEIYLLSSSGTIF